MGAEFEALKTRLTLETDGGNIVMRRTEVAKEEVKSKGLFGGLFGR